MGDPFNFLESHRMREIDSRFSDLRDTAQLAGSFFLLILLLALMGSCACLERRFDQIESRLNELAPPGAVCVSTEKSHGRCAARI